MSVYQLLKAFLLIENQSGTQIIKPGVVNIYTISR